MSSQLLTRTRKLVGVSALALTLALGSGAGIAVTSQQALAQVSVAAGAPDTFADLVEAVKPAVVSIAVDGVDDTQRVGRDGFNFEFPDLPDDHPFRRFFDQFGDQFGPNGRNNGSRPRPPRHFQAAGSGFIISADGYVVTNNHVVEKAEKVTVVMDDTTEYNAEIIGVDPKTDLALLKIEGVDDLPFVEFADKEARIGDWVVAVGNPFGLGGTVTAGIISARGRDIGGNSYGDFLQIDAAVNRGNSGGPAFNLEGQVVGVNTAIFSPNGGNVGIAFAIPASTVNDIINDLKDDGAVTRGFLGVAIQDVSKDIADSVGLPTARGALVTQPSEDAPAARAGIKSGDVIVEVDGDTIDNALDLSRTIARKAPGQKVQITVWRNGKNQNFDVVLDTLDEQVAAAPEPQMEPEEEAAPTPSSVGITLVPNSDGDGLLIQDIEQDSIAATKGFAVGDSILEADNTPVNSVDDFEAAVKAVKESGRSTILIKAQRGGNIRFIGLPLSDS
jgi:serine protease Do